MKNGESKAVACNGVPIFDGYGGVLTTEDATQLETMWEKSENYKRNLTSILDSSSKVSLEQQIQSASSCAAGPQATSKAKVKESEIEI